MTATASYKKMREDMKWKHATAARAGERIVELEQALGIPPADFIANMALANQRVTELEGLLAQRPAPAAPVPAPRAPIVAIPSAPAPTPKVTRQQLFALAAVFPLLTVSANSSDRELRAVVAKAAWQAHHQIAGLTDDPALVSKLWRTSAPAGIGKYMHSLRQERIDSILGK